jgi:cytoskeletal protein CcmA (bactofilin family)
MKTVIGSETRIAGALSGKDDLEVHGTVDGPVNGEAAVTIAAGARIGGEVRGRDVIVGGELTHAVYASGLVRLLATAKMTGDIEAPRIAIDEGAVFEGQVRMRKKAAPAPVAAAAPAPAATPASAATPAPAATPAAKSALPPTPAPTPAPTRVQPPQARPPQAPPAAVAATPPARAIPELAAPGRKPLIRKSS